ncbi:MAG: glycosyl transferase family 90 [Devosia sp.]
MDVRLSRQSDAIRLSVSHRMPSGQLGASRHVFNTLIHWFSQSPEAVRSMTAVATDGFDPTAATFAFSGRPGEAVLLPDSHFFQFQGYEAARQQALGGLAWDDRSSEIVWRGAGNGQGRVSFDASAVDDPTVIQRIRLALRMRGVSDHDVKLVRLEGRYGVFSDDARRLGLVGGWVAEDSWLGRKYALDIDGMTNAWSNLLVRLHYGCCVLKVESQFGYRQWYYDRLVPFEHYVPVKADMSDLLEQIDWVRSHEPEARQIAEAGQRFARTLDFTTVRAEAVEIITANWDR